MSAHTPGPWHVERFAGGRHKWAVGPSAAIRVCDAYSAEDARLIAAAPRQHDALLAVLHAPCFGLLDEATRNAVRLAIAAATGEQA